MRTSAWDWKGGKEIGAPVPKSGSAVPRTKHWDTVHSSVHTEEEHFFESRRHCDVAKEFQCTGHRRSWTNEAGQRNREWSRDNCYVDESHLPRLPIVTRRGRERLQLEPFAEGAASVLVECLVRSPDHHKVGDRNDVHAAKGHCGIATEASNCRGPPRRPARLHGKYCASHEGCQ